MKNLLVYAVIVNWNGKALLEKCLSTLYEYTSSTQCRVILVDNASTDDSVKMVATRYPGVKVIVNSENLGFAKANNIGIRYALQEGANYVLLLNNDVEITAKGWLDDFLKVAESNPRIGMVGCKLLYPDGTIQHAGGTVNKRVLGHRGSHEVDIGQYDRVESVDYVTGAALLVKAQVIRKVGMLDEGFTPLYYEDTDWCIRVKLAGYDVVYSPKPALIHTSAISTGKLNRDRKRLYGRRSLLRFSVLNYQPRDIVELALVPELKEAVRCIVVKSSGKLPVALTSDAAERVRFLLQVWWAVIRDFRCILYLRRERFKYGLKLQLH